MDKFLNSPLNKAITFIGFVILMIEGVLWFKHIVSINTYKEARLVCGKLTYSHSDSRFTAYDKNCTTYILAKNNINSDVIGSVSNNNNVYVGGVDDSGFRKIKWGDETGYVHNRNVWF